MKRLKSLHKYTNNKIVVPFLDMILGRTISRKLLVFLLATIFVVLKHIQPEHWIELAKIYIMTQGGVDIVTGLVGKYKDKKQSQNPEEAH